MQWRNRINPWTNRTPSPRRGDACSPANRWISDDHASPDGTSSRINNHDAGIDAYAGHSTAGYLKPDNHCAWYCSSDPGNGSSDPGDRHPADPADDSRNANSPDESSSVNTGNNSDGPNTGNNSDGPNAGNNAHEPYPRDYAGDDSSWQYDNTGNHDSTQHHTSDNAPEHHTSNDASTERLVWGKSTAK
jgi:hypothetical protein